MLPSLKTTLFFGLLILIVVSVSDERKMRFKREPNTFPNEDEGDTMVKLKKRVAKVGVELTPVRTGLSFQKAWHQVITVKLPSYDEYSNLLKSMTLDCNVYSRERYQEYNGDLNVIHEEQVLSSTSFPENDLLSETHSGSIYETTTKTIPESMTVINPIQNIIDNFTENEVKPVINITLDRRKRKKTKFNQKN